MRSLNQYIYIHTQRQKLKNSITVFNLKEETLGVGKMAQQVKAKATKADHLSSIPGEDRTESHR